MLAKLILDFSFSFENVDAVSGELIGFTSLTLPVILYFTFSENSKHAGTFGKRKLNLQVVAEDLSDTKFGQLLIRNFIKFLPWELAHFFIFRLYQFNRNDIQPPAWIFAGLIISQALALAYLSLLFLKGHRSIYEFLSSTRVIGGTRSKK